MRRAMMSHQRRLPESKIIICVCLSLFVALQGTACNGGSDREARRLTIAVNSGVEGDALKQAAKDYEAATGTRVEIAEFPYANLFEKEMVDHGRPELEHRGL
jgi:hypothetical protein